MLQFSQGLPDAAGIRQIELKVPLRVYSADGLLISEFGNERRIPIDYEDTPKALVNAILASEDDNFFNHLGIDLLGLVRATLANFNSGRSGQGASTITMQVARNFYLTPEKTYTRKIKEILVAIRLENVLEKREILSLYLNKIFLGHRAYGFGAAAEVYYGKTLNELNLAQIAMLAGLPKAPSSYNPIRNPERATIRRDYVLKRMFSLGWITSEAYQSAKSQAVTAKRHARDTGVDAPHIAEMVRSQLIEQYGDNVYWEGLNVYTTINSDKQDAAKTALRSGLQDYDRRHGFRGPIAKSDLTNIDFETSSDAETHFESVLREFPDSVEQTPALVIDVVPAGNASKGDKGSAKLWSRESGFTNLSFNQVRWAKPHIDANRVGDRPAEVADVLSIGDIVYIKPLPETKIGDEADPSEGAPTEQWTLSQIPNVSGSIISLDPRSGAVISLVGGYDFFLNKYNRATQSIRQPGSNIKPFIYSAAIEQGFTPSSMISGAPIVLTDPAHGTRWRPQNYSGKFYGPTRMRTALSKSMNLVSIRLLRSVGIPYARDYAERFGIDMSRFSRSLTMALGAGGVKPLEMISAYAVLANGGYRVKPYFIERITNRNGETIFTAPTADFCDECISDYFTLPEAPVNEELTADTIDEAEPIIDAEEQPSTLDESEETESEEELPSSYDAPRVMSHANNYLTVNMMKDVITRGTARKALALKRTDLAGKTGTTNDYVDAWFSGFNSQVVTTVWVGFDQPRSMGKGESGSVAALPIWVDYMKTGLADIEQDEEQIPDFIEAGYVDRTTGLRVSKDALSATAEVFVLKEMTPEHKLRQKMIADFNEKYGIYDSAVDDSLLDSITEQGDQPSIEAQTYDADGSENPSYQDRLNDFIEEPAIPKERIIETNEDTEGLF